MNAPIVLSPTGQALADEPDLLPLWLQVHDRLCAGRSPQSLSNVKVDGLSGHGIAQLRGWLDTTVRRQRTRSAVEVTGSQTTVPLRQLLAVHALRAEELVALVERAVGRPVVDRAAARRSAVELRSDLWAYAERRLPGVPALVARLRSAGVGAEDAGSVRQLIDALADAVEMLPLSVAVPLPKLAHDVTGDPHFFDLPTQAGQRLVSAVSELVGVAEPTRPDLVRRLLQQVGIIADRLSSTVLLLNVQASGTGEIDRRLSQSTLPVALTLADLTVTAPELAPQTLTVVENPSVLEVALAAQVTMPLACTSGQLGSVDHALLQLAVDAGVHLRYAGDVDRDGVQIAASVRRWYGAEIVAMDDTLRPHRTNDDCSGPIPPLYQEHDAVLARLLGLARTSTSSL